MNEITLVLDGTLTAQLGLQPNASAADIGAKIKALAVKAQKVDDLQTKVDTLKSELQKAQDDLTAEKTAVVEKELTAELDAAVTAKLCTAEERALLAEKYKGDVTGFKALMKTRKPYTSITAQLNGGADAASELEDLSKKTFDELWRTNKLARLKEIAPAVYEAKKKEKFK